MKIFGHRGANGHFTGNTPSGFQYVVNAGLSCIETDIRVTADQKFILIHDGSIRNPDGNLIRVSDHTLAELQDLSFQSHENNPPPYLSLEEYLNQFGQKLISNLEWKRNQLRYPDVTALIQHFLKILKKHNMMDRVILSSFDHQLIQSVNQQSPSPKTGIVVCGNWLHMQKELRAISPDVLFLHYEMLTSDTVSFVQNHDMKLVVWTVNTVASAQTVKQMGVDGIITDYPEEMRDAISTSSSE